MPSIDARLTALADTIERRRMIREIPDDPLSRSLYEFEMWIHGADADELANAFGDVLSSDEMQHMTLAFKGVY